MMRATPRTTPCKFYLWMSQLCRSIQYDYWHKNLLMQWQFSIPKAIRIVSRRSSRSLCKGNAYPGHFCSFNFFSDFLVGAAVAFWLWLVLRAPLCNVIGARSRACTITFIHFELFVTGCRFTLATEATEATSFPGLFPWKWEGRKKTLASAGHVSILHPEILGVIN